MKYILRIVTVDGVWSITCSYNKYGDISPQFRVLQFRYTTTSHASDEIETCCFTYKVTFDWIYRIEINHIINQRFICEEIDQQQIIA